MKSPIALFPSRQESFLLILPLVCLVAAFFELSTGFAFDKSQKDIGHFIGDVVFLNTTHIILTFMMLVMIPGVRELTLNGPLARRRGTIVLVGVLFIFIAYLKENQSPLIAGAAIFFVAAYSFYHTLRQSLGVSLLYTFKRRDLGVTEGEALRLERITRQERFLAIFIPALIVVDFSIIYFLGNDSPPWHFPLRMVIIGSGCLPVLVVTAKCLWGWNGSLWHKALFVPRYMLPLVAFYSYAGVFGVAATHGLEYLFITRKIFVNARKQGRLLKSIGIIFLIITLALAVLIPNFFNDDGLLSVFQGGGYQPPYWLFPITLVQAGLTLLHYHCDAEIFRMKDPQVRSAVGSLLQ